MIIGPCPYENCSGSHFVPIAPKCPAFSKETCEKCGRLYWLKHSRINPEAFTLKEFAERFTVNETTKSITSQAGATAPPKEAE